MVSEHAWRRSMDREISLPDAKHVLLNGFHESKKDQWSTQFNTWKYSIKGKTFNGTKARIVVAVDNSQEELVVLITIIKLDSGDRL